jgi:hypothetical protein
VMLLVLLLLVSVVLLLRLLLAAVVRTALRLLLTFLATALISCSAPAAAVGACCNTEASGSAVVDVVPAAVSESFLQILIRRDMIRTHVVSNYLAIRQPSRCIQLESFVPKDDLTLSSFSGGHHPV